MEVCEQGKEESPNKSPRHVSPFSGELSEYFEGSLQNDSSISYLNSHRVIDVASYEKEVEKLTQDFIGDWNKMKISKADLYSMLREKYIRMFPHFAKKYNKYYGEVEQ